MTKYTEKVAPTDVTKKQKKFLKRKSMNTATTISDIIRAYIDEDMKPSTHKDK